MNEKSKVNHHFNADASRDLLYIIDQISDLSEHLKGSQFEFEIDSYIKRRLEYTASFLTNSGGSRIPDDYEKIVVKKYDPIFFISKTTIDTNTSENLVLQTVGEGAFAVVSKYKDPGYNIYYAVKSLKKGVDEREKQRFIEEYKILNSLQSPYILTVYRFEEKNDRYVMEYCDTTLKKYYDKENSKISFNTRKRVALQFLYAMSYIHHKKILHRDLSYHNILIKQYDCGVLGVKLSDFGLGKTEMSEFTKLDTEIKGTIIDPSLDRFKNYSIANEIYAIGMILNFIFSGKMSFSYSSESKLKEIVKKCTNQDLVKRYKNVHQILKETDELTESDI
jgi:serine/threonine protein kinase